MSVPRRRSLLRLASVPLLAVTASCTVGPNFTAPRPPTTPSFVRPPVTEGPYHAPMTSSESEPEETWWHQFHDAELNQLEERTEKGNLDLQSGLLRIVEARAQVQVARAQGLPSLNASAKYNRDQEGLAGILKAKGIGSAEDPELIASLTAPINLYQVGFDASWELDLFGKVRRSVEAAKAQAAEVLESRNDMLVSLEAEVAQTYMQLRAAQLLKTITLGLIDDEKQILELTRNRQAHGLAQETDVESAEAQVFNLQSQLPQYEQSVAVSRHALAVLIGEQPEALDAELKASAELPALPKMVSIGVPSALARRRPDIRNAEATLHAATANIGVAMASLFPDVSLTGSAGLRNLGTRYLFDWSSKFYSAGPTISLPIFEGGSLVANIKIAKAQAGEAALSYRKTVLSALQEVEDDLVTLDQDGIRTAALRDTVGADQRSFEISMHAYSVGLSNYINVLNLELQTNQAKQQLAQASLNEITDLVKLYKALGGGWQRQDGVAATAQAN